MPNLYSPGNGISRGSADELRGFRPEAPTGWNWGVLRAQSLAPAPYWPAAPGGLLAEQPYKKQVSTPIPPVYLQRGGNTRAAGSGRRRLAGFGTKASIARALLGLQPRGLLAEELLHLLALGSREPNVSRLFCDVAAREAGAYTRSLFSST
jgi:hypothetical protein